MKLLHESGQIMRASRMHVRDVPESCVCAWEWEPMLNKWVLIGRRPDCAWHTERTDQ